MPASSDIYGQIQQPQATNMLAQLAQAMQVKGLQDQGAMTQYTLKKAQRDDEDTNALRSALSSPGSDPYNELLKLGKVKEATEYQKGQTEVAKSKSEIGKNDVETEHKTIGIYRDASQAITDPASAASFVQMMHSDPRLKNSAIARVPLDQALAQIPQDPAQFGAWKQQFALGAQKFMEMNKPTVHMQDAGGVSNVVSVPGMGGPATVLSTTAKTQTPDSIASNATSRANNRDTIAAENARAGVTAGGGVDENTERTAQAIASGQLPAPTGMALLNPKNQRILGRVMEINPQYDSTTVDAKKKAARDFASGTQGNAMRSFAVAGQHLDQLGTLVDALDNGNMQIVNRIGNAISQQTGTPAVTNFDAAKDVVSKEVIKAIVAGGGGVSEREELSKLMANAKSPAQLKGVIQQYRSLMGAQHDALLTQRRAAGLPDSTMPKYTDANGSPNAPEVPADIAAILAKHGPRKGM